MEIIAYVRPWKQPQQETIIAYKKKHNSQMCFNTFGLCHFDFFFLLHEECRMQYISSLSLILIAKCIDFIKKKNLSHTILCNTQNDTL